MFSVKAMQVDPGIKHPSFDIDAISFVLNVFVLSEA
jgi:hypothetical protein